MVHDVKLAIRALRTAPWLTTAAILLIALGVGANAAVFTVTYGLLIKPLPYLDPSRLAIMSVATPDGGDFGIPFAEVEQWSRGLRTVDALGAYSVVEAPLRGLGKPRMAKVAYVTPSFFDVLRLQPTVPRIDRFREDASVAILSERFDGGVAGVEAIGKPVEIGQRACSVLSVLPVRFAFPADDIDAWVSAEALRSRSGVRDVRTFQLVARLKEGVSTEQVRDDIVRLMREIRHPSFGMAGSSSAIVTSVEEAQRGGIRPALLAAGAGAILVLVVTCANVAMLLLSRSVIRRQESAVRVALGANRSRLIREALMESFILAIAGAMAGIWFAAMILRGVGSGIGDALQRSETDIFTLPVLGATALVAAVVTLLCGAGPAVVSDRQEFTSVLRGSNFVTRRPRRTLGTLVVLQIASAVVLLTGAVLLARTVSALLAQDIGVDAAHVLTLRLPLNAIAGGSRRSTMFADELLARVRALPDVRAAGIGSNLPPRALPFQIYVRFAYPARHDRLRMSVVSATSGFMEAIGAQPVSGRAFEPADSSSAVSTVLLSQTAAKFAAPESDLTGQELPIRLPPFATFAGRPRVVGIVRDIKYAGLEMPASAALHVPWQARPTGTAHLAVRTTGDPMSIASTVRRMIVELEPEFPVGQFRSLEEEIALSILDRRLRVLPAVGFGGLSLAVALLGVLGLLGRAAAERRREFAIRMALGASEWRVIQLMLGRAVLLATAGIAAGLTAAVAFGSSLRSLLFGVGPHDLPTLTAVAALVGAASVAAALVPATRAARTQPVELLRLE